VQLRSVESGQTLFLSSTNWSANSSASAPVFGLPPGWTLATVFVGGIPSTSSLLLKSNISASVTLGNLARTYNGTDRTVTTTTVPTNLMVSLTYNGSGSAPTNAGSYTVVGTISGLDYQGSATNTLVIGKAAANVSLENLSQTYDGTAKRATITTVPPGLAVDFTYSGSADAPTNAGSYTVIGLVNDANYVGSATNTLVIGKATANVDLDNLSQTYDGTAKSATAITTPPGLQVDLTYDGAANAPTNVGSYTVIGTVNDANYSGSATDALVIVKAIATVNLGDVSQIYDGTAKSATATTTPPGLRMDFTYDGVANAPTNVGSYTVIGTVNDANYSGSATNTLVVVLLQLTAPTWDGNGQFSVTFNTTLGLNYTVQFSSDLIKWIPALTFRGVGGPLTIIDPEGSSSGQRFYRVRSP